MIAKRGSVPRVSSWGRIQDSSGRRYFPKPDSCGRSYYVLRKRGVHLVHIPVYRLVNVLFNDPDLNSFKVGDVTDHILSHEIWNNHKRNVRWASKSFNSRRRLPANTFSRSMSQKVKCTSRRTGEVCVFDSQEDAAVGIGLDHGFVTRCVAGKKKSATWIIEPVCSEELLLPNEDWWPLTPGTTHPCASSHGRWQPRPYIESRYTPVPEKTGYVRVSTPKRGMHDIVLSHYEPRPSLAHTADHINRIKSDNRRENLRWVDKSGQRRNQDRSAVGAHWWNYRAKAVGSNIWLQFPTSAELAKHLGFTVEQLASGASTSGRHTGHRKAPSGVRYKIERITPDDYEIEGEEWIDIVEADWCSGGKYAVVEDVCE